MNTLPHNILTFVHSLLSQHLKTGDCVADCTAGNGNDTLFLAETVGKTGKIWAFDIQEVALHNTRQRLQDAGLSEPVELILDGHQNIDQHIQQPLDAVMFNLGYLPQGDKHCTTQTDSTLIAIKKSLKLLRKNGILSVVLYGGHAAGVAECAAIEQFSGSLKQQDYDILRYQFANRPKTAPYALIFRKMTDEIIFQAA
ncbi:MAG: class I SAM-dependent methyltransferase [Neisseriaceae bacterium]|nr:class I SAM-dependent methyltransferase [Neisseriaceae bacterium]